MAKKRTTAKRQKPVNDGVRLWRWIEKRMGEPRQRANGYGICAQFVDLRRPLFHGIPRFDELVVRRESERARTSPEACNGWAAGFWWPLTARGYNSRKAFCRRMAREAAKS